MTPEDPEDSENVESPGDHCRICWEKGGLTDLCECRGTHGTVHLICLQKWHQTSGASSCELCGARYDARVLVGLLSDNAMYRVYIPCMGNLIAMLHAAIYLYFLSKFTVKELPLLCIATLIFNMASVALWAFQEIYVGDMSVFLCMWFLVYLLTFIVLSNLFTSRNEYVAYVYMDILVTTFTAGGCAIFGRFCCGEIHQR